MWIADSVMSTFGAVVALGAPVVPAWLSTVSGDTRDYGGTQLYFDGNRQMNEPMRRASAILVTGHEGGQDRRCAGVGKAGEFDYVVV